MQSTPILDLDAYSVPGSLFRLEGDSIRCLACGQHCLLSPGQRGVCQVRYNENGQLRVPHGYVSGLNCDPIEKKPFFHVHPGRGAFTFGMLGCNFHCDFCQNWSISQSLRDPTAQTHLRPIEAEEIVKLALKHQAKVVVSSYNEPLITAEWAKEVFDHSQRSGLLCAMVSNGYATPEAIEFLRPVLSALKVDLKCFNDRLYRGLGGRLSTVLQTIELTRKLNIWLEVVTLLIPGFNDGVHELTDLAGFLARTDPSIPWHITAFHPDYRHTEGRRPTAPELKRAWEIGRTAGLRYVYTGNLPGQVGETENTFCWKCGITLIERIGFRVGSNTITADGKCPKCNSAIAGLWK